MTLYNFPYNYLLHRDMVFWLFLVHYVGRYENTGMIYVLIINLSKQLELLYYSISFLYWTGHIKKKVQTVAREWLPVIEDAILLNQYMPLEIVVYQPPLPRCFTSWMKNDHFGSFLYLNSIPNPLICGLVSSTLAYFWQLAVTKSWYISWLLCLLCCFGHDPHDGRIWFLYLNYISAMEWTSYGLLAFLKKNI